MDVDTIIKNLIDFNTWRRGADIEMIDPKIIGETIDCAILVAKRYKTIKEGRKKK